MTGGLGRGQGDGEASVVASRRLGTRVDLGSEPAHILVAQPMRRRPRQVAVEIDSASVTGLGFMLHQPVQLTRGQVIEVHIGGASSKLRVRHAATVEGYVGAEFIEPRPEVLPVIHRLAGGDATAERDQAWEIGHID